MRRVLIIHPDEARRRVLRAALGAVEVVEAATRESAMPLLRAKAPTLVVSHHDGFRRLLRDLERHVPGATRAVLCPAADEAMRRTLVDAATQGYDFLTIDEHELEQVRALVHSRGSARRRPAAALSARFLLEGEEKRAIVEELGNDGLGLRIEAPAPLEKLACGSLLPEASVWDGEALVMEPRAWLIRSAFQPEGATHARVGVSFVPARAASGGADRISDVVHLRGLLRRAALRHTRFEVQRIDGVQRRTFGAAKVDDGAAQIALSKPLGDQPFRAGQIVRLSLELSGRQLEGVAAVLEASPAGLRLSEPEFLMRHHRRKSLRAHAADGLDATIEFVSPLKSEPSRRPLLDLHPGGAAFLYQADEELLPVGLVLRPVTIETGGRRVPCEAVVQSTTAISTEAPPAVPVRGSRRCGLALRGLTVEGRAVLQDVLASVLAPEVIDGARVPFEDIWALFRSQDVRFPDYPPEDPESVVKLGRAQATLRQAHPGLFRSFVFRDAQGELLGHTSALRTFSRTWLAQHLVVKAGYKRQTHVAQTLVNLAFDYGEALKDVEFLRGLWRSTNRWPARVFGSVSAKTLRPGFSCLAHYTQLRWPTSRALPPCALRTRPATKDDLGPLSSRLRVLEDPVHLRSSDLFEEELLLPTLGARYRDSGFHRERHIAVVDGRHGPRGWVLMEEMSPGLIWMEMLNIFRIVLADPSEPDADAVRLALVTRGVEEARSRGRPFAEWHDSFDDSVSLADLGFTTLGVAMEFTAHVSQTREWNSQMLAIFERLAAEFHRGEPA